MFCMNFVANLTTFVDTYILLRHPNPSVVIIGKTVDLDTMEINKQSWFYVNSYNWMSTKRQFIKLVLMKTVSNPTNVFY